MLKASYITFTLHHLEQKGIKAGEAEPRCKLESEISESCHCAVRDLMVEGEGRNPSGKSLGDLDIGPCSWRTAN